MPLKFPQPPLGAATDVAVFHCPFIIDAPTAGELRVRQNVKVVVSRDGRIQAIDPNHEADKSTTANKTCVIVPGFVDCVSYPDGNSGGEWHRYIGIDCAAACAVTMPSRILQRGKGKGS